MVFFPLLGICLFCYIMRCVFQHFTMLIAPGIFQFHHFLSKLFVLNFSNKIIQDCPFLWWVHSNNWILWMYWQFPIWVLVNIPSLTFNSCLFFYKPIKVYIFTLSLGSVLPKLVVFIQIDIKNIFVKVCCFPSSIYAYCFSTYSNIFINPSKYLRSLKTYALKSPQ